MDHGERINRGKKLFEGVQRHNPCELNADSVNKIVYHEYFTSGHNDTGVTVSLQDADGNMLWKEKFTDDNDGKAWALTKYLERRFKCPIEEIEL